MSKAKKVIGLICVAGDGMLDSLEIAKHTDPRSAQNELITKNQWNNNYISLCDSDVDDLDEMAVGLDSHNSDTDGDGYVDGEEIILGHNPFGSDPIEYQATTAEEWDQQQ